MKALLTPRLLDFLIKKNYQFFLSQTTRINQNNTNAGITLKPVKKHPLLQKPTHAFSCYCSILWQPIQTISSMANTKIAVELNAQDLKSFEAYSL